MQLFFVKCAYPVAVAVGQQYITAYAFKMQLFRG